MKKVQKNAQCPPTVEIQLHGWAGIALRFGGELHTKERRQHKRDTDSTVVLSDVPCGWFYRSPPTSGFTPCI